MPMSFQAEGRASTTPSVPRNRQAGYSVGVWGRGGEEDGMGVYQGNEVLGLKNEECDEGGDGRQVPSGLQSAVGAGRRRWVLGGGATGLLRLLPGGRTC